MSNDCLAVLDFGSQYAHLIAKRLRRQGFYTEIHTPASPASKLAHARGLILSGGPASVYEEQTPDFNSKLLELELPISFCRVKTPTFNLTCRCKKSDMNSI